MARGRRPDGSKLVNKSVGSEQAKQQMKVIMQTITGEKTVDEACEELGVKESMFYRLRAEAIQAGVARLEPRPRGRQKSDATAQQKRIEELEYELETAKMEIHLAKTREEVAMLMPEVLTEIDEGKGEAAWEIVKRQIRERKKGRQSQEEGPPIL